MGDKQGAWFLIVNTEERRNAEEFFRYSANRSLA
jgi:hypothetical protein